MAKKELEQSPGAPVSDSSLLLLFGGAFDPVHRGHIACAQAAGEELAAAEVRLIPTARPPHRDCRATAQQRAEMVQLAVSEANAARPAGTPPMFADRCELDRCRQQAAAAQTPSYTCDTLAAIRAQQGDERPLCLLLGADALPDLPRWHRWRELAQLAHIAVLPRPGAAPLATPPPWQGADAPATLSTRPAGLLLVLRHTPWLDISATQIRAALADEAGTDHLPAAVRDYILRQGLYATSVRKNGTVHV